MPQNRDISANKPRRGRPPIDIYWRERIRYLAANEEWGAYRIAGELEREAARMERTDAPSYRTVQRELAKLEPDVRQRYRFATWPEAVEYGALPPEAGDVLLDLQREFGEAGCGQPTVRAVQWCWRVRRARPKAPWHVVLALGAAFLALEVARETLPEALVARLRQLCTDYLAYRAWDRKRQGGRWPRVLERAASDLMELSKQDLLGKRGGLGGRVASVAFVMVQEAYPLVQAARKAFAEAEGQTLEDALARLRQMEPHPYAAVVEQVSVAVREMDALDRQRALELLSQLKREGEEGETRRRPGRGQSANTPGGD
jgi:hypothetical protein